jgi:hypothetical protein
MVDIEVVLRPFGERQVRAMAACTGAGCDPPA